MKLLTIILLMQLTALSSWAMPRLDRAVGSDLPSLLTVVEDHEDKNLYYVFPQRYRIAVNEEGMPRFLYQESNVFMGRLINVEMTFQPDVDDELLAEKRTAILKKNPNAKFAYVIVQKASVIAPRVVHPSVRHTDCMIDGILIGQDVSCRLEIKNKRRKAFRRQMRYNPQMSFRLNYEFMAYVNGEVMPINHTVQMYTEGIDMDELYLDAKGRPITEKKPKK